MLTSFRIARNFSAVRVSVGVNPICRNAVFEQNTAFRLQSSVSSEDSLIKPKVFKSEDTKALSENMQVIVPISINPIEPNFTDIITSLLKKATEFKQSREPDKRILMEIYGFALGLSQHLHDLDNTAAIKAEILKAIKEFVVDELRYLCAYLNPDNIPNQLFSNLSMEQEQRDLLLQELSSCSLINENKEYFSVHRAIQDVTKILVEERCLIEDFEQRCIDKVLELIHIQHRSGVDTEFDYSQKTFLLPHLQTLFADREPTKFTLPMIQGYLDLALLYKAIGNAKQAGELYTKVLPLVRGRQDGLAAEVYQGLGRAHQGYGEFTKAKSCYEQAYQIYEINSVPVDIAAILNDLGMVYRDIGDALEKINPDQSKIYFKQAIDFLTKAVDLSKQNKNMVRYKNNLGEAYRKQWELDKAQSNIQAAITLGQHEFPNEKHRLMASAYFNLGNVCLDKQDYEQAKLRFEKAVAIGSDEAVCGKKHPLVARHTEVLGLAWRGLKDELKACECFELAYAILTSTNTGQPQLKAQIRRNVDSCTNSNHPKL